jgi:putative molybdopterin biosynthesis protein
MQIVHGNPSTRSPASRDTLKFMSVKQVADYLSLNEKKIYNLVREGKIPATKITGKWLFPRELVDNWLLESSHGGLLTDRLVIAGSDDPLLTRLITSLAGNVGAKVLVSYSPTGTRLGLELLAAYRADISCLHWGPAQESHIRHPALLQPHRQHHNWLLLHAFRREQGILIRPGLLAEVEPNSPELGRFLRKPWRWAMRQQGSGSQRFLLETLSLHGMTDSSLEISRTVNTEREAAAQVAMNLADLAPGVRASATEFGLDFIHTGWEAFDLALPRGVYFRALFQKLLESLRSRQALELSKELGGYDLSGCGDLLWGME